MSSPNVRLIASKKAPRLQSLCLFVIGETCFEAVPQIGES
jgi:hypothetical protein